MLYGLVGGGWLSAKVGSLVGVGVVLVVLDAPGLEGVDQGHEHDGAHYVLQQLVLAESTMAAVMPHHKHLQVIRICN